MRAKIVLNDTWSNTLTFVVLAVSVSDLVTPWDPLHSGAFVKRQMLGLFDVKDIARHNRTKQTSVRTFGHKSRQRWPQQGLQQAVPAASQILFGR